MLEKVEEGCWRIAFALPREFAGGNLSALSEFTTGEGQPINLEFSLQATIEDTRLSLTTSRANNVVLKSAWI